MPISVRLNDLSCNAINVNGNNIENLVVNGKILSNLVHYTAIISSEFPMLRFSISVSGLVAGVTDPANYGTTVTWALFFGSDSKSMTQTFTSNTLNFNMDSYVSTDYTNTWRLAAVATKLNGDRFSLFNEIPNVRTAGKLTKSISMNII